MAKKLRTASSTTRKVARPKKSAASSKKQLPARDPRRMTPIEREHQRINEAGSLEEETLSFDAPFNRTYGGAKPR